MMSGDNYTIKKYNLLLLLFKLCRLELVGQIYKNKKWEREYKNVYSSRTIWGITYYTNCIFTSDSDT